MQEWATKEECRNITWICKHRMKKAKDWLESRATACLKEDADWRQRE